MVEKQLADNDWISGDTFTMADCSAAPALFYSETLEPFGAAHPKLQAYYDRLLARPSFARCLEEARPYFRFYPFNHKLPAQFRDTTA
jgi:glutathione S-transferase